jgi:tRNA wybutosine-synthesizing protein 3
MTFPQYKQSAMQKLQEAKDKKEVDEDAIQLLDILNEKENYFTSSSCYGRIHLIYSANYSKKDSKFVGKWHRKVSFEEVKEVLEKEKEPLWFKMEPFILHISCRTTEDAEKILKIKQNLGVRRGGIFATKDGRVQIELEGTHKIDCPVKVGDYVIDDDYLKILIKEANERFEKNQKVWESLEHEFKLLK